MVGWKLRFKKNMYNIKLIEIKKMQKFFLAIISAVLLSTGIAYADNTIMITKSFYMDKVIFDGKWSFLTEWKKSSLDTLSYDDGTEIELRTAHQNNFIYIRSEERRVGKE